MKVSIVYWSGTGNTELMAASAAEGAKRAGADVEMLTAAEADASVLKSDALLSAAPQWERKNWKRRNSSRFSRRSKENSQGRKWGCSVRTDGATANGCAPGLNA